MGAAPADLHLQTSHQVTNPRLSRPFLLPDFNIQPSRWRVIERHCLSGMARTESWLGFPLRDGTCLSEAEWTC